MREVEVVGVGPAVKSASQRQRMKCVKCEMSDSKWNAPASEASGNTQRGEVKEWRRSREEIMRE